MTAPRSFAAAALASRPGLSGQDDRDPSPFLGLSSECDTRLPDGRLSPLVNIERSLLLIDNAHNLRQRLNSDIFNHVNDRFSINQFNDLFFQLLTTVTAASLYNKPQNC